MVWRWYLPKTWILKIHILKFFMTTTPMEVASPKDGLLTPLIYLASRQLSLQILEGGRLSFHLLHDSTDIWDPRITGRQSLISEPWLSPVLTSKSASHPANPPSSYSKPIKSSLQSPLPVTTSSANTLFSLSEFRLSLRFWPINS